MAGNVLEWCQDWYGENYYSKSSAKNPLEPGTGGYRVLRGAFGLARTTSCVWLAAAVAVPC
jgi:formylglycine-generating enzyme required for sulfatase activity